MMFPMYDAIKDLQSGQIGFTITYPNSLLGVHLLFDVVSGGELEKGG